MNFCFLPQSLEVFYNCQSNFQGHVFPFALFHKFRGVTVLQSINTVKHIHYEAFDREIRLEGHKGIIERGVAPIN